MQRLKLTALVTLMLFALPIVSVFGAGYPIATPILGTTGAPALAAPSLYSGVLNVLYADGAPVVLASNHISLELCGTTNATATTAATYTNANATMGCVTVASTLKQTAPGTYTYTFTPPSLTGIITIYIMAGDLADDNGRIFPSVDTSIGTYAFPASSTSNQASGMTNPVPTQTPTRSPAGAQSPESTQLTKQAVSTTEPKQQSPILPVVLSLIVLLVAAVGLAVYPTRFT